MQGRDLHTTDEVHQGHGEEVWDERLQAADYTDEYDYGFGCGRVPEHDWLPPLLDGDEARHTVQCVSVRSFSGFTEDFTSAGRQADLQVLLLVHGFAVLVRI